jgi:CPA2 family monovalent cation:H+ antiporter-2
MASTTAATDSVAAVVRGGQDVMHDFELLPTLTAALAAALLFGYWTHQLRLSPIVGYLLAGVLIGPYTPGFVANQLLAEQLAEVGVVLLMFGVGLHFHVQELLAVRHVALPGAITTSLLATALGALAAWGFGWSWSAGLVFGLCLSVASTVVLTRVLSDFHTLHTPTGHIAVGWLVVEDLFTVLVLVLLPALFGGERVMGFVPIAQVVLWAILKIVLLVAFTLVVGGRVLPWVLERVAATRSRELFTLTVLVVALGIAVGSAKLFGVSMALGAFLAGMVVGQSEFSLRAASEALPMRDAFAVLFFVSVGMLFQPAILLDAPLLVAATLAVVVIGKPLAAYAIVILLKHPPRVALAVSVALAQIGEFSFILAGLGRDLNILPEAATHALVAASIVSITINPLLYRQVHRIGWRLSLRRVMAEPEGGAMPSTLATTDEASPEPSAIVIGYGPVGRTVSRLLAENGIQPTHIELNLDTVRRLREKGLSAVYGDASRVETLREAGIQQAGSLILSAAGVTESVEIIRRAREENPTIHIVARAGFLPELTTLRQAGADHVFVSEGEVAIAINESILREMGATPDQIDRTRDQIREELYGKRNGVGRSMLKNSPLFPTANPTAPESPIISNSAARPAESRAAVQSPSDAD